MSRELPFKILDADNHFLEPPEIFEKYIDPKDKDLAIRYVKDPETGKRIHLFGGRPSKFTGTQLTYSKEELEKMLGSGASEDLGSEYEDEAPHGQPPKGTVPGMLLNRLNPLKDLSDEDRKKLVAEFRNQSEAYGNRDLRLALMDDQQIEAAVMYPAAANDIEFEFDDDVDSIYANVRAFNRWIHEEVGYAADNRMFLPPYLPLADPELAVKELQILLDTGAPMLQIKSGHAHGGRANPFGGRSPADPIFDPIWSRVNESGMRLCVHLGTTDYQKYGADWSEDPDSSLGDFDAFQWMTYWGDRPAMELISALILHNFFGRFPEIKVLLSEMGTVWLPYTLRKMDHAFVMGRKAKWSETGRLDARPSEIFRRHVVVAPFPEENVRRVVDEVGIDPIVFGSDFPHGEGLAYPSEYVDAQLKGFTEDEQRRIMRDNLADFLRIPV